MVFWNELIGGCQNCYLVGQDAYQVIDLVCHVLCMDSAHVYKCVAMKSWCMARQKASSGRRACRDGPDNIESMSLSAVESAKKIVLL
jgi:hypothetical protein